MHSIHVKMHSDQKCTKNGGSILLDLANAAFTIRATVLMGQTVREAYVDFSLTLKVGKINTLGCKGKIV